MTDSKALPFKEILLWIVCLAMLAVGAKNFEIGMSVDAPFYSSVSRNIARSGEWLVMSASTPDFIPYAEHPHLGYWTQAIFFKLFGATDPVARIPGQIFYVLCMLMLFFGIRRLSSEKTAVWTLILLWSFDRFSNFFSNAYLDPGLLFFSGSSLFLFTNPTDKPRKKSILFLAGLLLGLGFMQKGMVNLGFGPAFAWVWFREARRDFSVSLKTLVWFFSGMFFILGLYYLTVRFSSVPNFFEIYWASQSKQRFGTRWDWQRLVGLKYWSLLLKDSHFLLPLIFFSLFRLKKLSVQIPLILLVTFSILYACANLNGGQYWITILPWVAWLIAENLLVRIPIPHRMLVTGTRYLSIALLFLVQYTPLRVHGAKPPEEIETLRTRKLAIQAKGLYIDNYPLPSNFGDAGVYVWYVDLEAVYPPLQDVPPAERRTLYLLLNSEKARIETLKNQGWCLETQFIKSSLWEDCKNRNQ